MKRHLLALAVTASLLPALALSASGSTPVVRGEVIRDFARVTFEWPRTVYLTTKTEGNTVTLNFDRRANPDFGALLGGLSPYVVNASLSADGKSVQLTLDKAYRIRSFVSGNLNGVDIVGVDASLHRKPEKQLAALAPAAGEEKPSSPPEQSAERGSGKTPDVVRTPEIPASAGMTQNKKPEPKPAPVAEKKPEEKPVQMTEAKPEAPPEPPPSPVAATPPEPPPAPVAAAAPEAPVALATPVPAADVPALSAEPAPAFAPPKETGEPGKDEDRVQVFASTSGERTILRFAWPTRVAAATFKRGPYVWVVFNKTSKLDLDAVKQTADTLYPDIEQLPTPGATVLRIARPSSGGVMATKAGDSFEWNIVLISSPQLPQDKIRVDVNTEPPLPPHVFLAMPEVVNPVTIEDPDLGDTLLVVPLYQPGQGLAPTRRFIEFALLESAQGVVIQKIADWMNITPVRNGMRVGAEGGALVSPALASSRKVPEISLPSTPTNTPQGQSTTLFPYELWRADPAVPFVDQVNELEIAIAASGIPDEGMKLRLKLAQLYLAEGFTTEALGMVQEIRRIDSQSYVGLRAAAIAGGANFLMHRFSEAADDFAAAELQGSPEVEFWKNVLAELLGKPEQNYRYLENNDAYISKYPPRMRQRLSIAAADRAVAQADYASALEIMELMKSEDLVEGLDSYLSYLAAKIALETGKEKEGLEALVTLAQDYKHLSVRARAEFTLINYELKKDPESIKVLQPRLERLYTSWRGDSLEMETLKILGELYAQQEEYVRAMQAWRDLITAFPSTVSAAVALNKMQATFVQLFDGGAAGALPPLDQLSLYYEFRTLTPADAAGDRIINGIADRLVSIDLLEQAITLIDYRMRYLYEKEARSRAGAKLARIFLINRQPKKALEALQKSLYGENPEDLKVERDRLAAQAMVEMERYGEAAALLAEDKSTEAEAIRQRSWWKQKDWPKLIASVEGDLKNRATLTAAITEPEGEKLTQLALAYVAENDTAQLQYLRDYFTPLMQDNSRLKLFHFITEPQLLVTPEMFDAMLQQVEDTRQFIKEFDIHPKLAQMSDGAPHAAETPIVAPVDLSPDAAKKLEEEAKEKDPAKEKEKPTP